MLSVKADKIEMKADAYGHTHWQSEALFHDSVSLASEFLTASKKRFTPAR